MGQGTNVTAYKEHKGILNPNIGYKRLCSYQRKSRNEFAFWARKLTSINLLDIRQCQAHLVPVNSRPIHL